MTKVKFVRRATNDEIDDVAIEDGQFLVSQAGAFIDYGEDRYSFAGDFGSLDTRLTNAEEVIGNETDTYSASSTYALGSLVIYGGLLYKCTTAITVAEAWNGAKWTQIDLVNVFSGLKGKILWTNPSPTSEFAGKTVTLSETIANYDSYEVIYIGNAYSNEDYMTTGRIPKRVSQLTYNYYFSARRQITSISGTSVVFGNGTYYGTYGSETATISNFICVPWIIIGYKTGLFS